MTNRALDRPMTRPVGAPIAASGGPGVEPTAPLRRHRTLWEEGREPGRELVSLGLALALTIACLDLTVTGRMSALFDVGFVLVCAALALAVRPRDFFTVGVLPPLLMLATVVLLAMSRAEAIAPRGEGLMHAIVTGLGHHAVALVVGYAACLALLAVRQRVTRTGRGPRPRA